MKDQIQKMNKKSLSDATGISYGRLRKFASGQLIKLTTEEIQLIYQYLVNLSQYFKTEEQNDE